MDDLLHVLRADHERIREILDDLKGDPAEAGDPGHRALVKEKLVSACSRHEALEEMILWPEVRRRLTDGDRLALVGLDQEEEGKKLLNEVEKTNTGTEEFATLVHQAESNMRQHMMFEENQVFFNLRRALSDVESAALARRFDAARRLAPTRPHAMTPPEPALARIAGPVLGVVDRGRDLFARRGS